MTCDDISFDWERQFLGNRDYAVLTQLKIDGQAVKSGS
jgi:hypothetical protein